ncbi:3-deoxy-manno-octulosonate cytidylyltransferase [Marinicella sp. S1101]|uniref:3-deoxy-manno-octulosonate cytidylyltransferase n=1 Tax=Marinicella marina TaxID=2996016 RepID=UPI002260EE3A|nr:3-deoxy-manno-octulosonate cytidylyltransferase [Marinicella marina]MCX7554727.1 3-deoxy-manno-octulosonate cytidylyltransferase [Marinicella marina]MDJ1141457.1 3-deoxy-manno-octulosonate cytidylyltransferase [Marinicella marina]
MSDFEFVVCIPARYASSRLPGKPLIKLKGKELILWAVDAANQLGASAVVVATDDQRIASLVESHGHHVVMTRKDHQTGTDRLAECAAIMGWSDETWVLNYQGDEPDVPQANVQQVIDVVKKHPNASIGTLYQSINSVADLFSPNVVKLVTGADDRALYFSRAPIPWSQKQFNQPIENISHLPEGVTYKHHIGLYMYKTSFLHRFTQWPVGQMEKIESLEQLRALEHHEIIVAAAAVKPMPHGIDTPADVERFENS